MLEEDFIQPVVADVSYEDTNKSDTSGKPLTKPIVHKRRDGFFRWNQEFGQYCYFLDWHTTGGARLGLALGIVLFR